MKRVRDCYVTSVLPYGDLLTGRNETAEMWFYRRLLRMLWMEHVRNDEIIEKTEKQTGNLYLKSGMDS